MRPTSVDHQRMRLHWRGGIVEGVSILRRLALQLTLVRQRSGATIAKESVVADELNVVTGMARLDAVDANGVAVGRVARAASVEVVHWK